ncbi:hypothetical protein [Yinghuangia soli]|uniref:Uncharacterized protein n=1 Tax=Yinghuangia soli TaxID=2908204 RepID=A0AA41U316_9ACTN|nr:hypothetical protein [Yinghuangia soli]MCF2527639.1 hypothetical protein [Yinghuangia soli]
MDGTEGTEGSARAGGPEEELAEATEEPTAATTGRDSGGTPDGASDGSAAEAPEGALGEAVEDAPAAKAPDDPAAAARRARRRLHAVRVVAFAVVAVCVATITGLGVARSTVLDRAWYDSVLEREEAYDRLYDEVLVDPEMAHLTRDLLARLPVPPNQVTANLRLVLPPSTLRGMTGDQIGRVVAYLRGDEPDLRFYADLKPIINNLGGVAEVFVGDLTGDVPSVTEDNAPAFVASVQRALDALALGQSPDSLPALDLAPEAAPQVADLILEKLPEDRRAPLREPVIASLRAGDLGGVLVAVVPALFGDKVLDAKLGLASLSKGEQWDLVVDVRAQDTDVNLGPLPQLRAFTVFGLGKMLTLACAFALGGLYVLWRTAPHRGLGRLRGPGAALAAGGVLAAGVCLIAWAALPHLIPEDRGGWAPSVRSLVDDLQGAATRDIVGVWITASAVPVFAGSVIAAVATAAVRRGERGRAPAPRSRVRTVTGFAAVGAAGALALTILVPVPTVGDSDKQRRCNGMPQLCDRRYDEVAYLATHNSMSSTADRFISPLQDPDLITQLDLGARALLVDTYMWETPEEIAPRLAGSDLSPEEQVIMAGVIDRYAPARPGLWLCHSLCRGGALPLVGTLRSIGDWLDANPNEVVTLIVQDAVSGEQTVDALQEAGMDRFLATPPADADAAWPTLRQMIAANQRLVVFAERGDGPDPRYRNFYRYGMETPYMYRSPEEMDCVPNRGGTGKRLFLMNNFVTAQGGSRIDAGKANTREFLLDRARRCEQVRDAQVTYIAVDFATIGDARGAVDALNSERTRRAAQFGPGAPAAPATPHAPSAPGTPGTPGAPSGGTVPVPAATMTPTAPAGASRVQYDRPNPAGKSGS